MNQPINLKQWLHRVIYSLLVVAFVYVLVTYQSKIIDALIVLRTGTWYLVAAAFGVLLSLLLNQAALYATVYRTLHLPVSERRLLILSLSTRFITVIMPSAGLSGLVPFVQDARRQKIEVGPVVVANLIYVILWYSTFALFLLAGLVHLFLLHDLAWFEISAAIALLATNAILIVGLVLAWTAPQYLAWILHQTARLLTHMATRLHRPSPLTTDKAAIFVHDITCSIDKIRHGGWAPRLRLLGHALLNELLHLAILFLLAEAFGTRFSYGVLVTAYSISILFWIMSPTPGGMGFVEGILVLVLTTLGVPHGEAIAVTLAYRGLTFWLPFFIGFGVTMAGRIQQKARTTPT
jgi:uncharacterized protein (TIRG00374 family)